MCEHFMQICIHEELCSVLKISVYNGSVYSPWNGITDLLLSLIHAQYYYLSYILLL